MSTADRRVWPDAYSSRVFWLLERATKDTDPSLSFAIPGKTIALSELVKSYETFALDPEDPRNIAFDIICREFDIERTGLWKAIMSAWPPKLKAEAAQPAEKAVKHDAGKPRWTLLPMRSLQKVIDVLEFGAKKYEPNGWKGVEREYHLNAAFRHMASLAGGEKLDPESGLPHAAHAACRMLFVLYFDGEKP